MLFLAAALGASGYLVWLFWGTGLVTAHHQAQLRAIVQPVIDTKPSWAGPTSPKVVIPGGAIGILVIPRIHLNMVVVQGVDTLSLEKGPGHYPNTVYPWQDHGRVAIAGHRTTYLHPFWSLNEMRAGDPIEIQTEYGMFWYRVTRVFATSPGNLSVLDPTAQPSLVLTTCTPRFSASQRLVVLADRV
jgi:LPXTG-site transpeptidase (sortase) family protein